MGRQLSINHNFILCERTLRTQPYTFWCCLFLTKLSNRPHFSLVFGSHIRIMCRQLPETTIPFYMKRLSSHSLSLQRIIVLGCEIACDLVLSRANLPWLSQLPPPHQPWPQSCSFLASILDSSTKNK